MTTDPNTPDEPEQTDPANPDTNSDTDESGAGYGNHGEADQGE